MNILCTNDDGVLSPGLAASVQVALAFGEVSVAAPSSQKTGAGRSLIGERKQSISATELEIGVEKVAAYHLEGTPALVLKHAFATVLKNRRFDLAISGINYGENIGFDITSSGTVGAAVECATIGIPAIAVSVQTEISAHRRHDRIDWRPVQYFLGMMIRRFVEKGKFTGFDILKLDVPMGADEVTKWKVCSLQPGSYFLTTMRTDSADALLADSTLHIDPSAYDPGTDAYALNVERKVAVTPLVLDWTARETGSFFD
jgi:5'-nucleotidase